MAALPKRVQLHRAISKLGLASRAQAEKAVRQGLVRVNGRVVTDPLTWVTLDLDKITLADRNPATITRHRHLALHKPKGPVTTRSDELGRQTVYDLFPVVEPKVEAIGRLDADSEGLLLFTSDSVLASRLLEPGRKVAKVYQLTVRGLPDETALQKIRAGVDLPGSLGRTLPCQVRLLREGTDKSQVELILKEGKNRQARRMLAAVGHKVTRLIRSNFGPIHLADLAKGQWRPLTEKEILSLYQAAEMKPPGKNDGTSGLAK